MCGIVGIVGKADNGERLVQAMLASQTHRGPDAKVIKAIDANCVFGHNRLSIIDLNETANQPMFSADNNLCIVFNGEIYNYKELRSELQGWYSFSTQSDTEVLIASYLKWGVSCLERLNGMFAFAIWNKREQTLFAARDRFGVKPFNYSLKGETFYFSSEIKALWAAGIGKKENYKTWANYFSYGTYGLPHETFWSDILQLPAGHYLEYKSGNVSVARWYNFAERISLTKERDEASLMAEYFELLNNSIQLRFRSDVPVGFNISGGLDSSALLALVNRNHPRASGIEAFTFYTGNSDYDELPWVEEMIKTTGNPLNACLLNHNDVPALMENVSYHQDEPFGGFPTLAYSQIFKAARSKGIVVLLDGQGMDEAWAGYDYYRTNSGFTVQGTTSSPVRPEVLEPDFAAIAEKDHYEEPFDSKLQNLQYRDIFYTKIPRALRFNDRISMMYSTELREPFLDYRLVELAFAQPEEVKIKNGEGKWMLREITRKLLGDKIALAPKRPLQTPQREWIGEELKEYTKSSLDDFSKLSFVNAEKVNTLWSKYLNGESDNSFYIWQWINTALLLKQN